MNKSLTAKIQGIAKKVSGLEVSTIDTSTYADKKSLVTLPIPALNLAHSGSFKEGPSWGSHQIVGESKTFKTLFLALQVGAYLNARPNAICIFTDSEGGANLGYWESVGAPMDRIYHIPVLDVEQNSTMLLTMIEQLSDDTEIILATDSIGQLGSRKEIQNTEEDEANKQDFTRAKSLNSFWRIIVPLLNVKRIPYFWIGGVYDTTDQYKPVALSGGKKGELGADSIWYVSKSQQKEQVDQGNGKKKEQKTGWNFNIKIMKGRFAREEKVIPITVRYNNPDANIKAGIYKWSSVLEIAREVAAVEMPSNGRYVRAESIGFCDDKAVFKKDMDDAWFEELMMSEEFHRLVEAEYRVSAGSLFDSPADSQPITDPE